jgi:anti-sigma regulatory factor (Ser/Thr protein kinase)
MKELSLHILDIAHNSLSAGATLIKLTITESKLKNRYEIILKDNGKGIDPAMLPTVTDAFTTSRKTRKVGLGLPLFKQNAEQAGGSLSIQSTLGVGTQVCAVLELQHIDRPAIGDIAGVVVQLAAAFPKVEFIYKHSTDKGEYEFNTEEIKQTLDGVPMHDPDIRNFLLEMLNENLDEIGVVR